MAEYYMFHKPQGCISARRDPRHKTVMDYFTREMANRLFPVGRLDRDTEGLMIITDDGKLNYELLDPSKKVPKTYLFYAVGSINEDKLRDLSLGAKIYPNKDIVTAPAIVEIIGKSSLYEIKEVLSPADEKTANRKRNTEVTIGRVTVTEGKKHEVKRMILYSGGRVVYLKRISFGTLTLDESLKKGEYRSLTQSELKLLKKD